MIKATFYVEEDYLRGFEIAGHSGYGEEGSDVICASVSSAAYMAANTVTDIAGAKADIEVDEGYLKFIVSDRSDSVQTVLRGLKLHVTALADDYSKYIICNEKTFK